MIRLVVPASSIGSRSDLADPPDPEASEHRLRRRCEPWEGSRHEPGL